MYNQSMHQEKNIQRVLDFIEENLKEELNLHILAQRAYMSPYHFLRVFQQYTGERPMDYVKRRRLTKASFELVGNQKPIIQIAMDYGYKSQEAFHRIFKKYYNCTPKQYRKENFDHIDSIKTPLNIDLCSKNIPRFRIIKEPSMSLIGYQKIYTGSWTNYGKEIAALFEKLELKILDMRYPMLTLRVFFYFQDLKETTNALETSQKIFVGVEFNKNHHNHEDMVELNIPAKSYLTFEHKGEIDKRFKSYRIIYEQIIPSLKEEVDPDFTLEIYDERLYSPFFNEDLSWKDGIFEYSNPLPDRSNWIMFSPDYCFDIYLPLKS